MASGKSLETFIRNIVGQMIGKELPHLGSPAVIYAEVTGAKELPKTYELAVTLYDDGAGTSREARLSAHWWEYTLAALDRFGNPDESCPPLPGVRSKMQLEVGSVVAVGLVNGELIPIILEEAVL